jgi:membrane peptidoglycan carboxypeptidase
MRTENGGGPVTGGSIPAEIWRTFMQRALEGVDSHEFDLQEPKYVTVTIDRDTGLLAGEWCVGAVEAKFIEGKEPTRTSTECIERARELPDVRGLDPDAAREALAEAGFEHVRVEQRLTSSADEDGVIVAQEPDVGASVHRTDDIVIYEGDHPFAE